MTPIAPSEDAAATFNPLRQGRRRLPNVGEVIRLFAAFAKVYASHRSRLLRVGFISGLPGFVTVERGYTVQTTALEFSGGRSQQFISCGTRTSLGT